MGTFVRRRQELCRDSRNYIFEIAKKNGGSIKLTGKLNDLPIVRMENCCEENFPYAINEVRIDKDGHKLLYFGVLNCTDRECYDDYDEECQWTEWNVSCEEDIIYLADYIENKFLGIFPD